MKTFYYTTIFAAIAVLTGCGTQKIAKGNDAMTSMSYFEAVSYYEQSLGQKGSENLYSKIGYCYLKMNKPEAATDWYKKAFESEIYEEADMLNYAHALKESGQLETAKVWFAKYLAINPDDKIAAVLMESCDSMPSYYTDSAEWNIKMLDLGGSNSKFSPTYYDKGLVFCSPGHDDANSSWDGKPYLDLYHVQLDEYGNI